MELLLIGRRAIGILAAVLWSSVSAFAQQPGCAASSSAPTVHAEGLAEKIGDVTIVCSGGQAGSAQSISFFISLNANITNRVDANNNPLGVTVSVNTGSGAIPAGTQQLYGNSSFFVQNLTYTVPAITSSPVTIVASGIRAAVGTISGNAGTAIVTASLVGLGAQFPATGAITVAIGAPTLLSSQINNGIPCSGSPLPAAIDFPDFIASNGAFSTIRLTEASPSGFSVKDSTADTGLRVVIRLSGYAVGDRVFVPDAIVGSDGTLATSAGAFNSTVSPGIFTPSSQLLLSRVSGADMTGNGGMPVLSAPTTQTSFSSVSEIALAGGAGYIVYEVISANPNLQEIAQVPLFLVAPQIPCSATPFVIPSVSVALAPVSNVVTATQADPIPRFSALVAGSDCQVDGDCAASYFPQFSAGTAPVSVSGASLGSRQGASTGISNAGGGVISFTASITYGAGAQNWLSVTPSSGELAAQSGTSLQLLADPSMLQPGLYTATITLNGGTYGTYTVPVTFTVGPPGVTISSVLNAASGSSPVAPGSYAALYGMNLGGQNVSVTFSGFNAPLIYTSATQINLIVPASLGSAAAADVVVSVDGKTSNSFKVNLALNAPGIFNPGIENADGSVNGAISPATNGSFVAVYLTGLSTPLTGQVTVNIGNQTGLVPLYAGAQPTLSALDQVNVIVPTALAGTANPVQLSICIPGSGGQPACSNSVNLYVK